ATLRGSLRRTHHRRQGSRQPQRHLQRRDPHRDDDHLPRRLPSADQSQTGGPEPLNPVLWVGNDACSVTYGPQNEMPGIAADRPSLRPPTSRRTRGSPPCPSTTFLFDLRPRGAPAWPGNSGVRDRPPSSPSPLWPRTSRWVGNSLSSDGCWSGSAPSAATCISTNGARERRIATARWRAWTNGSRISGRSWTTP